MAQLKTRIVLRNDSSSNWEAAKAQVLLKGEPGVEFLPAASTTAGQVTYKVKMKIGDGVNTWEDLPYVNGAMVGDNKSIDIVDDVLSLHGLAAAAEGAVPHKAADGSIEWSVPVDLTDRLEAVEAAVNASTPGSVAAKVQDLETKVGAPAVKNEESGEVTTPASGIYATLENIYTKTETDTKIAEQVANANHLTREIVTELPAPDAAKPNVIYMIKDATAVGSDKYKEYMLFVAEDGTKTVEPIGDTSVDFTQINDALDKKVDKVEGSRLITSEESNKLNKLTLNEDGNLEVSGSVAAANVTGLPEAIVAQVTGADTASGQLAIEAGAQVNVLEKVAINGVDLTVTDKKVDIPVGSETALGVVKSSTAENAIAIESTGIMKINTINVNTLVQTAGETLILNGGNAALTD